MCIHTDGHMPVILQCLSSQAPACTVAANGAFVSSISFASSVLLFNICSTA